MNQTLFAVCLMMLCLSVGCSSPAPDYESLQARTENAFCMVVEIPAGTNLKLEYDPQSGRILPDQQNGADRYIEFLPYPGNYGFIPGTLMERADGGDGDPLDVFLIGMREASGAIVEIVPIGMLELMDGDEEDTKVIAVPADPEKRIIQATNFQELLINYDAARRIIEEWFLHYKGYGAITLVGWKDEAETRAYINRWTP